MNPSGGSDETSLFHTVLKKTEHSPGLPILTLTVESLWFQVMLLPGRLKLGWVFTLGTVCFREETSEPPGMGSWRVPGVNTHPGDPIWNKWDSSDHWVLRFIARFQPFTADRY